MCFMILDEGLWCNSGIVAFAKFKSCYHKCIKAFFGYQRFDGVGLTSMLFDLSLPSFDTGIINSRLRHCLKV